MYLSIAAGLNPKLLNLMTFNPFNSLQCTPTIILIFQQYRVNFYSKTGFYPINKPELDEKRIFTKS